jgi:hypothetical protein
MTWDYDVVVYLNSLPKIRNHNIKVQIMRAFAEGAQQCGARVRVVEDLRTRDLYNARLAVIIGWVGMSYSGPHIYHRENIINHQKTIGGRVMSIDGSCFKYHPEHGNMWLRYSLDSVFYNVGEYANNNSNHNHWHMIRSSLDLELKGWRHYGDHILMCLQRDNGWNAKGFDQVDWIKRTIKVIGSQTATIIKIRPHPGTIDQPWAKLIGSHTNVHIIDSKNRTLRQDLKGAKAAVFYNSSSSVLSVLEGIPTFVSEESAVTWDVANHNTRQITDPHTPDRTQWVYNLCQAHWTIDQSRNGEIYRHFAPHLPA